MKISKVHIRINLGLQVIGFLWFIFVYFYFSLIKFKNPEYPELSDEETKGWIEPWIVEAPNGLKYWYMTFEFGNAECDTEHGFHESSDTSICDSVKRTWIANTLLNADLIFGLIMMGFSIWWTSW